LFDHHEIRTRFGDCNRAIIVSDSKTDEFVGAANDNQPQLKRQIAREKQLA
jgi:hypothetical protein